MTLNQSSIIKIGNARGFSLIELMVALVLGAVVVMGVVSVFIGNRTTSEVTYKIGQIQQANQIAFQLLARDIQHAGFVGCNNFRHDKVRNLLNTPKDNWWSDWETGIRPIEQGQVADKSFTMPTGVKRDSASDALILMFARGTPVSVQDHNIATNTITLAHNDVGLTKGEFVIACDAMATVLFQISDLSAVPNQAKAVRIEHAIGSTPAPGNDSDLFGSGINNVPVQQSLSKDSGLVFPFETLAWYVGEVTDPITKAKSKKLFRVSRMGTQEQHEEVMSDIHKLQLTYLASPNTDFKNGNDPTVSGVNSRNIHAVKIELVQLNTKDADVAEGLRTLSLVVNVRNDRRI